MGKGFEVTTYDKPLMLRGFDRENTKFDYGFAYHGYYGPDPKERLRSTPVRAHANHLVAAFVALEPHGEHWYGEDGQVTFRVEADRWDRLQRATGIVAVVNAAEFEQSDEGLVSNEPVQASCNFLVDYAEFRQMVDESEAAELVVAGLERASGQAA